MQPQCREVRVENDEYESEQQRPNIARGRLEKQPYLCVLCSSKMRSHSPTLFARFALLLTFYTSLHSMTEKHVPHLLTVIHMCWFKGHRDAHEAYTANMYI